MTGHLDPARSPRVIAGIDGSPHSAAALAWAAADARLRGWELMVVTCCGRDVLPANPGTNPATGTACEQFCQEMLDRLLRGLPVPASPSVSTLVLHGDPVTALINSTAAGDVLVVGTRGQGRVRALLLGSVAQGCVERAHCPVVVVPPTEREAAAPIAGGCGPVVAGVDSSPGARAALRFAAGEARLRHAGLVPVHVVYPDYTTAQAGDDLLPPLDSAWAQLDNLVRSELADLNVPARPVAVSGTPEQVLLRWTQSAVLVAVGSRGAGRLRAALPGSVIGRLLRHGQCPIAIVTLSADP